jgi:hypothetical protein
MKIVCECSNEISKVEVWILKDTKDFEARKLVIGQCPLCHRPVVSIYEKRITDKKIFAKENISGNNAVQIINKETKRMLCKYYKIEVNSLNGWIYGVNKEIKNRQGSVTQIRQYSADFRGNKKIVKKLKV